MAVLGLLTFSAAAHAQELPDAVLAHLSTIEDFSFGFSQPGFYAVLAAVQEQGFPPGSVAEAETIEDWHILLERPGEFRGRPVTITGVVGRNSAWRLTGPPQPTGADTGEDDSETDTVPMSGRSGREVWQLELRRRDQPIACTAVLTNDASDIPLGASVRITGYFVMVRQYYSGSNRIRQAALIVGQGPTLVSLPAAEQTQREPRGLTGLLITAGVGLLAAYVLLRRGQRRPRTSPADLRAKRPAPQNLAEDLATWAEQERNQQ